MSIRQVQPLLEISGTVGTVYPPEQTSLGLVQKVIVTNVTCRNEPLTARIPHTVLLLIKWNRDIDTLPRIIAGTPVSAKGRFKDGDQNHLAVLSAVHAPNGFLRWGGAIYA